MSLFDKKKKREPLEYAVGSQNTNNKPRYDRQEKRNYDNELQYRVLQGNREWSSVQLTNLENHLRDSGIKFESYPLKSGSWEIRYYGKYIGNWDGFEYAGNR